VTRLEWQCPAAWQAALKVEPMRQVSGLLYFVAILLVVAMYVVSYFGGRYHGGGRGAEIYFSPDTLELKSRSELRAPLFGFHIYRSSFKPLGHYQLVEYLINKGYWKPNQTSEPRWIWIYGWNDQWSLGYGPLSRHLSKFREFWMDWTEKHPEFAAILWPRVLEQIRDRSQPSTDGYVGQILELAQYSKSYDDFRGLLEAFAREYPINEVTRLRWQLPQLGMVFH
jgi:hypothetical protein